MSAPEFLTVGQAMRAIEGFFPLPPRLRAAVEAALQEEASRALRTCEPRAVLSLTAHQVADVRGDLTSLECLEILNSDRLVGAVANSSIPESLMTVVESVAERLFGLPKTYSYSEENCPSKHWNPGDDICEDCGKYLG